MIYFDNAATTFPKPYSVAKRVNSAIIEYGGNPGRGGHKLSMRAAEKVYEVRKKVALFFNAEPQNIIFTNNCTMSLNIAIKGLIHSGDHVIISSLEHNSVVRPLEKLAINNNVKYSIATVNNDNNDIVGSFRALIKENTKAIICTHASNVSGLILPIKELGQLCKQKDILFIVDAAQSAGVLPIDIKEMNISALCTAGHKGLYGITGTGLLVLNNDIVPDSIIEGGTGSISIELTQPDFAPDKFESGTLNVPGIFSIDAGIDFLNQMTLNKIYKHEFNLCNYVFNELKKDENIILCQKEYKLYENAPIVSFNIKNMQSDTVVDLLDKNDFALRGGLHCSPLAHKTYGTIDTGMVRFSPSIFSKEVSVEKFVKFIRSISKKN